MLTCAWSSLPEYDRSEGIRFVERALELDPNDPEANRIMGASKLRDGQFDASRRYYEKAMALSPSDAFIKGRSAAFYNFTGESQRALALLDEAEELDPFLPVWCVEERLAALYALGNFEEAIEIGRGLPFQTQRSRLYHAASHVALGNLDQARHIVEEALALIPGLTTDFIDLEYYRDRTVKRLLIERASKAGLPRGLGHADA
jgi:tetratricopeptide (TPR) repeat protein